MTTATTDPAPVAAIGAREAAAARHAMDEAWQQERDEAAAALIRAGDPDAIPAYLRRWCDSQDRPVEFLRVVEAMNLDSVRFWRILAAEWCGFDRIPHRRMAAAFRQHRTAWSPDCMRPADRADFDALPARVTLFRGQSALAPVGLAWTLNRQVAEQFARGHRDIPVPSPVLLSVEVRREAVAFMSTERGEAEAVLHRTPPRSRCEVRPLCVEA